MKKVMCLLMAFGVFAVAVGNISAQNSNFGFSRTAVFQGLNFQENSSLFGIGQAAADIEGNLQKPCSKDGGEEMDISWKNNTKMTLRINWVNSKCEEEKNDRELKPGEIYEGTSYVGHWFMIRDFKTNKQLGYREVKAEYANMGIPK